MDEMSEEQMVDYIDPRCKEMFDAYLLVGYKADDHKIALIGDLGHPKVYPELNKKLRPLYMEAKKLESQEDHAEEDA